MNYETIFHFVCTNKLEVELLEECHIRHILISYAFANRVTEDGSLAWIRDKFDTIFIDSGAHTAFTKGKEVKFEDYSDFLKREKDNYDIAAQLDIIGNQERTADNYRRHVAEGTEWVLPILTAHWRTALAMLEKDLVTNYLGLGGSSWWKTKSKDRWNHARSLPTKYKYHGFAMGSTEAFQKGWLYSIDSSSWSFGARGREAAARINKRNLGVKFGKKSISERLTLRRVTESLKDDFDATETDVDDVINGVYRDLLKVAVIIFYRPLFREIGIFEQNFRQ